MTRATLDALAERFEQAYEQVYGLRVSGSQVEIVTWSVTVSTPPPPVESAQCADAEKARTPEARREVWEPGAGQRRTFGQHWRFDIVPGEGVAGPALVVEDETTVVVPAGWQARADSHGHLMMEVVA